VVESFAPLSPDKLIEPLDHTGELFMPYRCDPSADPLRRQRPYLTDFYPRVFREMCRLELEAEGKAGPLRAARQCKGYYGSGFCIEYIAADNENGS